MMAVRRAVRSLPIVLPLLGGLVFGAFWIDSYSEPRRFIFLPGGDVGLGFKSSDGILQWIEYAPWDSRHLDTPWWSVAYQHLVLGCGVILVLSAYLLRRFGRPSSSCG